MTSLFAEPSGHYRESEAQPFFGLTLPFSLTPLVVEVPKVATASRARELRQLEALS
jgi:hypothetical protein